MRVLHTDIGIGAISSILILVADTAWLTHDILANGINIWYIVIGLVFIIGYIGLAWSLHSHHHKLAAQAARHCRYYEEGHQGD